MRKYICELASATTGVTSFPGIKKYLAKRFLKDFCDQKFCSQLGLLWTVIGKVSTRNNLDDAN